MKINKFRGMTREGVWVYGDLIQTTPRVDGSTTSWIKERSVLGLGVKSTPTESFIEVNSETVGQFTGLVDINEVEVYEKDILEIKMEGDWQVTPRLVKNIWDVYLWINESDSYLRVNSIKIIGNIYQNYWSKDNKHPLEK